ncbi:Major facilitator family transporter [Mycobacteroides abscessus subsp. massiliense]|nr:Major facilitator family transporter [Mycobacteroides abscessus subsp. massiliense]
MLTRPVIVLFSLASGLAVATIYFSQPLLDTIGAQFSMPTAHVGIVLTLTQIGYAIGLLLVVPLGDVVDQRRLIIGQTVLLSASLCATAISPNAWTFLASVTALGALAVVTQVMVTYTAVHAAPERQGGRGGNRRDNQRNSLGTHNIRRAIRSLRLALGLCGGRPRCGRHGRTVATHTAAIRAPTPQAALPPAAAVNHVAAAQ